MRRRGVGTLPGEVMTPMECCGNLRCLGVIDLGGGAWADDVRLQLLRCENCDRPWVAVVEDSRRGALESDGCDRVLRPAQEADWRRYEALLKLCPDSQNEDCQCCAHGQLRQEFVRP